MYPSVLLPESTANELPPVNTEGASKRRRAMAFAKLEQAISDLGHELMQADGAQFRILVTGKPRALNSSVQEQIYVILREALTNASRHSKASSVEAELEYMPGKFRVIVRDNGCGINLQVLESGGNSHWGLLDMRERADSIGAQFRIWSRRGAGTEVEVSVPGHIAQCPSVSALIPV